MREREIFGNREDVSKRIRKFYIGTGLFLGGRIAGAAIVPIAPEVGYIIGDLSIICGALGVLQPLMGIPYDYIRRVVGK